VLAVLALVVSVRMGPAVDIVSYPRRMTRPVS